jgi:Na+/H+ antiporter NhaD/arsenite permease-like protein
LGAVASFLVLWVLFRKYREAIVPIEKTPVETWFPTVILISMVLGLALSSFIKTEFSSLAGVICMAFGLLGLGWQVRRDRTKATSVLKEFDWDTSALLAGIFVLVGGLESSGCIAFIAEKVMQIGASNAFNIYSILVWLSVSVSAFVDNVPYVTAMIPVGQTIASSLGITSYVLLFGILIGACIGGNITPIGAAANIVGVGLLKKNGYRCSFLDFAKIGLPFTLVGVGVAYWLTWLVWSG